MQKKKPDVDIVKNVLEAAKKAYPKSEFVHSLALQYEERGGLSARQLEGLLAKSRKIEDIPANWLATLEAMILKKPRKHRSELPDNKPLYQKQEKETQQVSEILQQYPQHKRVLYFKSMLDNNQSLSPADITELNRFHKLLKK